MLYEGLGPSNRAGHGAFVLCSYEVPVPYVAVASTAVTFTRALVILTTYEYKTCTAARLHTARVVR